MGQTPSQPGQPDRWFARRRHLFVWAVALVVCICWQYAGAARKSDYFDQHYVWGWDSNFYFAWGRSLALDGDLDFENDFAFVGALRGFGPTREAFANYMANAPRTPLGRLPNYVPMGAGLLSLPLLWTARGCAAFREALTGCPVSPFAAVYPFAFALTSVLAAFGGLALSFRLLSVRYGASRAFRSVVVGTFGLWLAHYILFEPTMSHAMNFGCDTLFIAVALRWRRALCGGVESPAKDARATIGWAFGMGLVLGVATMVRYTNALFAVFPMVLACCAWLQAGRPSLQGRWGGLILASLLCAAVAAAIGFLPQLVAWKRIYGTWWVNSYGAGIRLWPKHLAEVLFGSRNSLFLWTPLAVVGVAGLIVAGIRGGAAALGGLAVLAATAWVYGQWDCYWLGDSYGMRGFADSSFFFFLGLAEMMRFVAEARHRWMRQAFRLLLALLVAWNLYFMACYRVDVQPHGRPFAGWKLVAKHSKVGKRWAKDWRKARGEKTTLFTPAPPAQ